MHTGTNVEPQFVVAHVLFLDIVGYSKLLLEPQRAAIQKLNEIVRNTAEFQRQEVAEKLVRLATGDGVALVYFSNLDSPVINALEIAAALKNCPEIQVRMGIHSGQVSGISDVNDRSNVSGAGINFAQRVMDCGDGGHILLSKHVAEDLQQLARWKPFLHDLGEVEVKHGVRISIVNLYTEQVGNPELPEKVKQQREAVAALQRRQKKSHRRKQMLVGGGMLLIVALSLAYAFFFGGSRSKLFTSIPKKSIAVLPFENRSEEKQNSFFADGVQDEVLTDLAKIGDLKVISPYSVSQYKIGEARDPKKIGEQLGVANLLEGGVQREQNRVRVNAQLINVENSSQIWAQTYDRDLTDVFAIQSEIAKTIADQLKVKLSMNEKAEIDKPPTTDLSAYDMYVQAKTLFSNSASSPVSIKEKTPEILSLINDAIKRDPKFLLAYCLLSKVRVWHFNNNGSREELQLALQAAQQAQRLEPDSGETHIALGLYYYLGLHDYDRAKSELALASRTLPNDSELFEYLGYIQRREGHWDESNASLKRALDLDPRYFLLLQQLAFTYQNQQKYAEAIKYADRALTIIPNDPDTIVFRAEFEFDWHADINAYQNTINAVTAGTDPDYSLCDRNPEAIAKTLANYPAEGTFFNGVNYPKAYWEGAVALFQGDTNKAQDAFSKARIDAQQSVNKDPNSPAALSLLGLIDAGLGRKQDALNEGRKACEMLPISKDATDGPTIAVNLAEIYAWTGEKDLAIKEIDEIERVPNLLTYGLLKLSPRWDSLRADPRFQKIVADVARKPTS